MANDVDSQPMVLDTAAAGVRIGPDVLKIRHVVVKPSAGSWVATLTDGKGRTIIDVSGTANESQDFHVGSTFYGLIVPTLTNITNVQVYV